MKNLLFFSYNQNKIIEVKNLFKHNKIKILDLNQYAKVDEPIESGVEFVDNAKINEPAYLVFQNYELILKWNRSLRFGLAVCTLKNKFKNEI